MWILWVVQAASAGGCKAAIGDAVSAWEDLAVPIPTGGATVPAVNDALDAVTAHTAVARALRAARTRKGRADLSAAVVQATTWLDANPTALGAEAARSAVTEADRSCPP